jgi:hypothetical protein
MATTAPDTTQDDLGRTPTYATPMTEGQNVGPAAVAKVKFNRLTAQEGKASGTPNRS